MSASDKKPKWLSNKGWFKVPNELFSFDLTVYERAVLTFLYRMSNPKGYSFPSISTIAAATSISERSVKRAISGLVDKGWVSVKKRFGKNGRQLSNIYKVMVLPEADSRGRAVGDS